MSTSEILLRHDDNDPGKGHGETAGTKRRAAKRTRGTLLAGVLLLASVLVPFLFWRNTWFGASLSNEELRSYLSCTAPARKTQHALVQFTERARTHDAHIAQFYPLVADLAAHDSEEIRMTAAWAMGWVPEADLFHEALKRLLGDAVPLVRRNAALSLSKFGDRASRPVLLSMLAPYAVRSPLAGEVTDVVRPAMPVRAGMHLATVRKGAEQPVPVPSPLGGKIIRVVAANGKTVSIDDTICVLGPAEEDMWEALRALVLVGIADDVSVIREAVDRHCPSERVARQAELTCSLIGKRTSQGES